MGVESLGKDSHVRCGFILLQNLKKVSRRIQERVYTYLSLPPNTIAIIYAARKHITDFPITCHSRDSFGRHREAPAKSEMALVAPVQVLGCLIFEIRSF
jgi:hypothetical protein